MQRQLEERLPGPSGSRRRLAQLLSALRYDLSWRFARPGAFRQRFEQAIANLPQGICLYDSDDRLQLVNDQFCRIYNQPMHRLRTGMRLYDVLADSCALGNYPGRSVDEIYAARKEFIDRRERGIFLQQLGDGRQIAIHHQPLEDGGWVCTYEDITERRKAEAKVEFLAHHDSLTELPNRRLFIERLDHAIAHSSADKPCALLCLDLDGFKDVNDTLGHAAGDILLKNVAMRLKDSIQTGDTCARLGGDEFAIVLPSSSAGKAVTVAYELASSLRQPYFLGAFGTADVAVSIGIAVLPDHALTSEELMLRADQALYRSKNARLGLPVVFEKKWAVLPTDAKLNHSWEGGGTRYGDSTLASDLALGLQRGCELYLNYQPIYDARNGLPVAVEALARWKSPDRGHVAPLEFIKVAEENGLIDRLLEWALEAGCREAASWDSELKLSINLSPLNLDSPQLIDMIVRVLAAARLPARRLIVELTEETALERSKDRLERLRSLSALGAEIWLDDFGSGFANFEYLQYLRCDVLKIDRTFLAGYETREPLLRGMINLAHGCGSKVVVEGVETEGHYNLLCALGCDLLQGYWLAKPLEAGELHAALQRIPPPYHESRSIIPDARDGRIRAPLPKRLVENQP